MQAEANPVPCSACFAASVLALLALIAGLSDATAVGSPVPGVTSSSSSSSSSSTSSASAGSPSASGTLSSRTVRTKYGAISGVIVTFDSRHLEPVEAFRGVPYASPPTGNLRFMPPVTGAMWSGVRMSDRFGPVCPQRLPDISNETLALRRMPKGRLEYLKKLLPYLNNQSEDCLYLNIYAPAQGTRESGGLSRYPVMVFVHGESYEWNSGNPYDGSVLASYGGVVVVTINYRLGVLGFLNANTDAHLRSPSNYGLMDQIAALHWIQENIAAFGGDPGNVTVVGHGTGAACVHFLMASSAVPDGMLFHRAVLMSGSALSPWALIQTPSRYAHQVARHANCSPDLPHTHLLKCLRERPLASLLAAPVRAPEFTFAFGPSVDGVVIDSGEPPGGGGGSGGDGPGSQFSSSSNSGGIGNMDLNALNSLLLRKSVVSRLAKYDLLLGVVKAEAYFSFSGEDVQYGIESDRRSKILRTYVRNTFRYHLSEILATIVNEYTDWERPVQHPINIRDETLEALSDAQVVAPVVHTADLHSSARKNSYLYVFDYQTKYGDYPQRQGCIHGEELPYLFGVPLVGGMNHFPRNYTKSEILLSEAAMIYWSNFARAGNPNEPQEQDLVHGVRLERNRFKNIEWTAYEAVHKKYLILDTKPRVKSHFRAHRLSFWLNLVPDLHRPGGDDVPPSHHLLDDHDHGAPRVGATPPPSRAPKGGTLSTTPGLTGQRGGAIIGNASGTSQSLLPSVVESSGTTPPSHEPEDGFAAYSTALSLTIAIGCSLLILNVMVFAGVYYRRDKTRLHQEGEAANDGDKRNENGRMPNSICADLLVTGGGDARSEVVAAVKLSDHGSHHIHSRHNQYQLPEFSTPASHDNSSKTLPKPPPPPRTVKPPTSSPSKPNLLQGCGCAPESQPLLPSHNLQHLNAALGGSGGTLKKKHENKTQDKTSVEDLRV